MESSNDISHPVRDAFQELGHKARVAATSAYVALPVLMASAPSVAYGHETGEAHTPKYDVGIWAYALLGLAFAPVIDNVLEKGVDRLFTFFENKKYR